MTRKRLEELLAKMEPNLRRRFAEVMQRTKSDYGLARLEMALSNGTISSVLDDIERAAATFATQTEAVSTLVAREVADQLAKRTGQLVSYDGTNQRAVQAMRAHRLRLVSGLRDEQRTAILDALSQGTAGGINPRQQAIAIRDSLGLTAQQAGWVQSYRKRLESLDRGALSGALRDARFDDTVERAIAESKPLTAKQIDKMVDRYAARALKYRAEVVARTESLRAVHEGAELMYAQAIDEGTIEASRVVCTWHAGNAPRTRESHVQMKGQKRLFGQPFVSGYGYELRYPCDPDAPASETVQCRCTKSTRVYPTAEAAAAAVREAGGPAPASAPAAPPVIDPPPPAPPTPPAPVVVRPPPAVVTVPEYTPGSWGFSPERQAAYRQSAFEAVPESRWRWSVHTDGELSDVVADGLSVSPREFAARRRAFAESLPDDQLDAALFYSHEGDVLLNGHLRRQTLDLDADLQAMAETLDAAIDRAVLAEEIVVARGMDGKALKFADKLSVGDVYRERGYTSTSATSPYDGQVQLRIRLPKGSRAAPIPSRYGEEHEYLLPRGAKFRVVSKKESSYVDEDGTHRVIELELELVE